MDVLHSTCKQLTKIRQNHFVINFMVSVSTGVNRTIEPCVMQEETTNKILHRMLFQIPILFIHRRTPKRSSVSETRDAK